MDALTKCSFCGKSNLECKKLVAATEAFICDGCIELAVDILDTTSGTETPSADTCAMRVYVVEERLGNVWGPRFEVTTPGNAYDAVELLRECAPKRAFRAAEYVRIARGGEG